MEVKSKKDPVFRFKHFAVSNALSAMRVGTDGVLLGAWAITDGRQCVWDVGAGTGLISLMLAQRSNAEIYGVEIDAVACNEASTYSADCTLLTEIFYGYIMICLGLI